MIAKPTPEQMAWQGMEIGLFIHFNMFTYAPDWNWRTFKDYPSPELFNPTRLDTDQWMRAAKAIGAKYAVLTAKHCEGFCLWPTDAYPYSVKQSKWRDGKGDVVRDFVNSCRKFGIRPGIYYSTAANAYLKVDNPGRVQSGDPADQARYKAICEQQLTELWSRYGELAEIWFDGGSLPPQEGGPDIGPLIKKFQPKAMVFQSAHATIRWVGNEDGIAPYPCWATARVPEPIGAGDPDGQYWRPAECDVPLRDAEWGWKPNQENLVRSLDDLMDIYYKSVGRNCSLLLNSTPDRDGLVPEVDMQRYAEFGAEVTRRFAKSLAETEGEGTVVELALEKPTVIDHVVTMEQIAEGERMREYVIEGLVSSAWKELCRGQCIGHKRIDQFAPVEVSGVRLRCLKSVAEPLIRRLAVYRVEAAVPRPQPGYTIPLVDLATQTHRQVIVDKEKGQYLGHPTTVLLEDNKTMIAVYPKGHGRGAIVMKRSADAGLTWSDRLPVPDSWSTSQEVPTIHRVTDKQRKKRLILFSGLYPCRMSVSEDDGLTWSELTPVGNWGGVVTMSSVERLKNGDYMALFHDDGRFLQEGGKQAETMWVYKTVSSDGGLTWAEPEAVATHPTAHLCEPCIIRSPDGGQLAVLLRENSRRYNSFVIFSDDEGRTWTPPRELPGALTGDRHAARYAPDGRLFISFRDTTLESPTKGDWVGWVGTYYDIVHGGEGQYRVRLMDNLQGADCGYAGVEIIPDGTFVTTSYGHWAQGEEPYIVSVRFKLEELDKMIEEHVLGQD